MGVAEILKGHVPAVEASLKDHSIAELMSSMLGGNSEDLMALMALTQKRDAQFAMVDVDNELELIERVTDLFEQHKLMEVASLALALELIK
jgi:hypothetical protein